MEASDLQKYIRDNWPLDSKAYPNYEKYGMIGNISMFPFFHVAHHVGKDHGRMMGFIEPYEHGHYTSKPLEDVQKEFMEIATRVSRNLVTSGMRLGDFYNVNIEEEILKLYSKKA